MSVCPNCGKDNRKESRFCQACGTRLPAAGPALTKDQGASAASVSKPAPPASAPSGAPEPQRKRSSQEVAQGPTCSSCGTLNAPGMRFCKMCGSPFSSPAGGSTGKVTCASCGGQTPAGYKFCQHCGSPLPQGPGAGAPASAADEASAPAKTPEAPAQPVAQGSQSGLSLGPPAEGDAQPAAEPAPAGQRQPVAPTLIPAASSLKLNPESSIKTLMDLGEEQAPAVAAADQEAPAAQAPKSQSGLPLSPGGGSKPSAGLAPIATSIEQQPQSSQPTLGPGAARQQQAPLTESALAELVTVNRDGSDGQTHMITEESFDLGRTMGQLQFEEDPYLSDRHCRFFVQNDRWLVQDLQSVNGIYLRSRSEQALEHGDQLLLGKQVLVFEWLSEHERELAPAVEQGVLFFGSPLRSPWARLRQLTVAGIYRDVYYLQQPRLILGREEGDLLFPDDEFMSRRHLSLALVGSRAVVQDLGSSNGTYLRIRQQHLLQAGDMIRLGDQLLRFQPK